jgi:hypothetical protein
MGCVEDARWVLECENSFVSDDAMLSDSSQRYEADDHELEYLNARTRIFAAKLGSTRISSCWWEVVSPYNQQSPAIQEPGCV